MSRELRAVRAVKGMNDVLPEEMARVARVESAFARTMALYGFREVRTPLVEPTSLFVRAIGNEAISSNSNTNCTMKLALVSMVRKEKSGVASIFMWVTSFRVVVESEPGY